MGHERSDAEQATPIVAQPEDIALEVAQASEAAAVNATKAVEHHPTDTTTVEHEASDAEKATPVVAQPEDSAPEVAQASEAASVNATEAVEDHPSDTAAEHEAADAENATPVVAWPEDSAPEVAPAAEVASVNATTAVEDHPNDATALEHESADSEQATPAATQVATAKASAKVVSAKDEASDTSNLTASDDSADVTVTDEKLKEPEPAADTAKIAAAASSAVDVVAEGLQDEGAAVEVASREVHEAAEQLQDLPLHHSGSPFLSALAIVCFVGVLFGTASRVYKEATYVSPYQMAASSAHAQSGSVMNTYEGFLEMTA